MSKHWSPTKGQLVEDPTPSISEIMERIQKLEYTVDKIIDVLNGETKA